MRGTPSCAASKPVPARKIVEAIWRFVRPATTSRTMSASAAVNAFFDGGDEDVGEAAQAAPQAAPPVAAEGAAAAAAAAAPPLSFGGGELSRLPRMFAAVSFSSARRYCGPNCSSIPAK